MIRREDLITELSPSLNSSVSDQNDAMSNWMCGVCLGYGSDLIQFGRGLNSMTHRATVVGRVVAKSHIRKFFFNYKTPYNHLPFPELRVI